MVKHFLLLISFSQKVQKTSPFLRTMACALSLLLSFLCHPYQLVALSAHKAGCLQHPQAVYHTSQQYKLFKVCHTSSMSLFRSPPSILLTMCVTHVLHFCSCAATRGAIQRPSSIHDDMLEPQPTVNEQLVKIEAYILITVPMTHPLCRLVSRWPLTAQRCDATSPSLALHGPSGSVARKPTVSGSPLSIGHNMNVIRLRLPFLPDVRVCVCLAL